MLEIIPSDIRHAVENHWRPAVLQEFVPVAGGCINNGGKLTTDRGTCFIKWNNRIAFPQMFDREAQGMRLLGDAKSIRASKVLGFGETPDFQFILLEWIEPGEKSTKFWSILGGQIAAMHRHTAPAFGLDHDNYIGSLEQDNHPTDSWTDFFVSQRLQPQIRIAVKKNMPVTSLARKIERLYPKVAAILPEGKPSLLHGDLWDGNLLTDTQGRPCLIDPAVYYGHREIEIAYTQLFGNFDQEFYSAYREDFPMDPGFEQRIALYNLYPLLVHVNLFGGDYVRRAEATIDKYL